MKKIHIVMADTSYEGSAPVRAFAKQGEAEVFAERCRAYHARRPQAPFIVEDTPENDAEHEAYWVRFNRWKDRHPGGPGAWSFEYFTVHPLTFIA